MIFGITLFDLVNGLFEAAAGGVVIYNGFDIWKKRAVAGQTRPALIFFICWGVWNIIFYPTVGAWFSAACGAVVLLANLWVYALVWKFRAQKC